MTSIYDAAIEVQSARLEVVKFAGLSAIYIELPQPIGQAIYIKGRDSAQFGQFGNADVLSVDPAPLGLLACSTCRERIVFPILFDGLTIVFPWIPAERWTVCDPIYQPDPALALQQEVKCRVICPNCNERRARLAQSVFSKTSGGRREW